MSIASIRKRVSGATPGPWRRTGTVAKPHWYVSAPGCLVHGGSFIAEHDTVREQTDRWIADATFIAHARRDIPALVACAEVAERLSEWYAAEEPSSFDTFTALLRDMRVALSDLEALP